MPADRQALLAELHDHLVATRELPVDRTASRWIGEAEAVAGDVVDGDPPPEAVAKRVRQLRHLLENVDDTGHPDADEHVTAALALCGDLEERIEEP